MTAVPFTHVGESRDWLGALRRYFVFSAVAHLIWEFAHMSCCRFRGQRVKLA